jgi:pimeloyl-ACP methyl ester carboxylesterase
MAEPTSVLTVGAGEHVVLCLHGWFGSATGWGWLPDLVDQEAYTWVFPDYRGYGARRDVAGEHTLDEIAADVLAVADGLGAERFSLLGHSMGGTAAARVLVEAPERVRALVGLSPVPASGVPFDEEGWALFSGAAEQDGNRAAIIDLTTGNRLSGRWVDRMVRHSVERSDRAAVGDYLRAWAHTDFSELVRGSERVTGTPVKVIVGEHDPALSAEVMQATWLVWHADAELEVLANAGHYATEETPVALVTSIEEFLARRG